MRDGSRRVLRLVARANSRREKVPVLLEMREEVEERKALVRLCHDAKAFPNANAFEHAVRLVVEIAKRNAGSLKSQQGSGRGRSRPAIPETSDGTTGPGAT